MKRFLALAALAVSLAGTAIAQEPTAPSHPIGPVITLHTTMGDIQVTLDPVGAPKTAAQFLGRFIKDGASINAADPRGFTPLHHALHTFQTECVDELLDLGADPNARDAIDADKAARD